MHFVHKAVNVECFKIAEIFDARKAAVCHAQFLTFIYVRRSFQRKQHAGRQFGKTLECVFCARLIQFFKTSRKRTVAAYRARLVVVFKIVCVPADFVLSFCQDGKKPFGFERNFKPLVVYAVGVHVGKRKDHVQFAAAFAAQIVRHRRRYEHGSTQIGRASCRERV